MITTLNRDVKTRPRLKRKLHQYVMKPIRFSTPVELENKSAYEGWKKGDTLDIRPAFYKSGGQCYSKVIVKNITRNATLIAKAENAHKYSDEFISWDDDDLSRAVLDGPCPSLTGEDIEPDGKDCHGFPSIILASMF